MCRRGHGSVAELTLETFAALGSLNCRSACTTVQYVCRKVHSRKVSRQVSTAVVWQDAAAVVLVCHHAGSLCVASAFIMLLHGRNAPATIEPGAAYLFLLGEVEGRQGAGGTQLVNINTLPTEVVNKGEGPIQGAPLKASLQAATGIK